MTRTAARSSGASAAAGWPTFSGPSDPPRQGTCPRFPRHAAPGSRGPASRQLGPRPSWRRRLNPWKREMRKTPSRSLSLCPMFDGDATDDDPPAPRLVVTDDAETGATVPSHELPVPEVGDHRRTRAREAQRDRAAQRGNNAARNHVLRVAHHNMRQSRNQSPRPSVDRLDMGWGALETLASQPVARAREEGSRSPRGAVTLPRVGGAGVGCACAGGACGVRARAGGCVRLHHVRR